MAWPQPNSDVVLCARWVSGESVAWPQPNSDVVLCARWVSGPAIGSSWSGVTGFEPTARFVLTSKLGADTQQSDSGSAGRSVQRRALMCLHVRGIAAQLVNDSVVAWLQRRWVASPHLPMAVRGRVCRLAHRLRLVRPVTGGA